MRANQKLYSHQKLGVSVTETNQQKGVRWEKRERKLRSGVNWQGALQQKGVRWA
jgi:hypothetical protein